MFIDNSAGPREFGPNDDASLELPTEGAYRVQEALRVMGWDPHHPRVFSQAKALVPVWLPLTAGMTWAIGSMILSNSDGIRDTLTGWAYIALFLGTPVWILSDVTLRRYGVDYDKIWTRFGPFFYRQIRFNDITRIGIGIERYKIWAGKTKINIDYHRYDYALFHLRLLEELHHRHIQLPQANITDPNWDEQAQIWRNGLAEDVWVDHRDFYNTNPEQLAHLNTLTPPPDHYDD
ncbi:hypothetical protein O2A76_01030 [Cutibacterium acnes subsp. acnes]|uniref:hypothetical protein n=1 Tax=Cutibacterium acnes TaxID=1747 RepID=UPI0022AA9171|nr:hypothetical protein [Cutibacterium acnes]WHE31534.1 hypothetical protein O2A76_01030 [Cutibacterium acnes subsp. acnes]